MFRITLLYIAYWLLSLLKLVHSANFNIPPSDKLKSGTNKFISYSPCYWNWAQSTIRIIELLRLEMTFKIIEPNHNLTMLPQL